MKRLAYSPQTTVKLPNIFGDGSDGDVTITGTTTLTTNKQYRNLTINAGAILNTGGCKIYVQNRLLNYGTIRNNGTNASGTTPGNNITAIPLGTDMSGGAGRTTVGAGNAGTVNVIHYGTDSTLNGAGGEAGANPGGTGAAGYTTLYSESPIADIIQAMIPMMQRFGMNYPLNSAGCGGGGGNATGAGTNSGAGGGGGGVILIAAKVLDNTSGSIQSNGGNGSAATGAGNAGGGGGGAGGIIILVALILNAGTTSVAGGTGGAKVGTGVAGGDGEPGVVLAIEAT